jgi:ectoine hydroxylase-related dioxygenase (phytanoyl-CoA dioxygenase family)
MKTLSEKQIEFYWENGYLVIENLLTEEETDLIYNTLSPHNDKEWSQILNPDRFEFLIAHSAERILEFNKTSEKINYIESCKISAKKIRNLMKDKKILSIITDLYNEELVALSTHVIWKKPGTKYASQAWNPHQDNAYGQNSNAKLFTINLFLDDVFVENGALYNYPGSHKEGLLEVDFNISYQNFDNPGKTCVVPSKYKKQDIITKKGSLYIQHGNLIHGSYGNITDYTTRGMFSATYLPKNENFVPGTEILRKKIKL